MTAITMLHPGAMGSAVAHMLVGAGHRVGWVATDRSEATRQRAGAAGLVPHDDLASAVADSAVVISLCPPAAAVEVARSVAAAGFTGTYVDANAVQPATTLRIADLFDDCVDGSVIGGPPFRGDPQPTRLWLSGPSATAVADLFDGDGLDVQVLAGPVGRASGLKMAFAAWTKGSAALVLAARALARAEGVEDALVDEWGRWVPDVLARSARVGPVAAKAWRHAGEMDEIAATMAAHDLPAGFHEAAAAVYEQLADLRHQVDPTLDDVLDRLA